VLAHPHENFAYVVLQFVLYSMAISGVFKLRRLHYVTVYAKIKNIKRKFELSSTQWSLSESLNASTH